MVTLYDALPRGHRGADLLGRGTAASQCVLEMDGAYRDDQVGKRKYKERRMLARWELLKRRRGEEGCELR
jgi:hypothetical protein